MKKSLRIAVILIVNLVILFFLVEVAGLVLHYRNEGMLFYTRPAEEGPAEVEQQQNEPLFSEYRLQPYWGYSTRLDLEKPD